MQAATAIERHYANAPLTSNLPAPLYMLGSTLCQSNCSGMCMNHQRRQRGWRGQARTTSQRSMYSTRSGLNFFCAFLMECSKRVLWEVAVADNSRPGVSMKRSGIPLYEPSTTRTCTQQRGRMAPRFSDPQAHARFIANFIMVCQKYQVKTWS